jgi:hypothetical protein
MTGDHDVRVLPRQGSAHGLDVAAEISLELRVRQINETPDVEALVLVQDEHRKQLSDVRPEQNAAPRVGHGSVRREVGDPFEADCSSGIDPRIPFGPPLLAKQHDVVPVRGEPLGHPRREDVRARALEQPPVPQQDAHPGIPSHG